MHGLRNSCCRWLPYKGASERDRALIATPQLAALTGQPVALPPKTGRVGLRVKQAALQASERAYQQWQTERPSTLDPETHATELKWPFWQELPDLGDTSGAAPHDR